MSKIEEKIAHYTSVAKELNLGLDEAFIAKVTTALGPVIFNKDAETVSCSDNSELDTVKKNFLGKKLGISDDTLFDTAIKNVCEAMGSSNRNKYRALFYALLAKEFGKEEIYA